MDYRHTLATVSPRDTGPADIFIINDINLSVPPELIEILVENTSNDYKVLRSKITTKIVSGQGSSRVNVNIPFLQKDLLVLHRLVVELKNSPFCFIENRYIRETMTPDSWPSDQNMAFGVMGFAIVPYPGTTDALLLQLNLVWFNYFPYGFNWLYREEWETNWMYDKVSGEPELYESGGNQSVLVEPERSELPTYRKYGIGWNINRANYQREVKTVVTAFKQSTNSLDPETIKANDLLLGEPNNINQWSLSKDSYETNSEKTIYEMEAAHAGEAFDLLPLPDNMSPSLFVFQPKDSRVYVRYINYLQRDSLLKNFNIDIEEILSREDTFGLDRYFGVITDKNIKRTYPLTDIPITIRDKIIQEMWSYNSSVHFVFDIYQQIELPEYLTENGKNGAAKKLKELSRKNRVISDQRNFTDDPNGEDWTYPFFLVKKKPGDRRFSESTMHPIEKVMKAHLGTDIPVPEGTPIYAPADCTILIRNDDANNKAGLYLYIEDSETKEVWSFLHLSYINVTENQSVLRGAYLGNTGETGASKGQHLHLEYRTSIHARQSDPESPARNLLTRFPDTPNSDPEAAVNAALKERTAEVVTELSEDEQLTPQDLQNRANDLEGILQALGAEGWYYYDQDVNVTNVWHKPVSITVSSTGADTISDYLNTTDYFLPEGIVFTNMAGVFQHNLVKIPILSHEFPTLQHLGSSEPTYSLEFHILDTVSSSDGRSTLEGISPEGRMIQGMRNMLYANARAFRSIPNSWCLSTDTFITRFLGTFEHRDILEYSSDNTGFLNEVNVKKRTSISECLNKTVPGSPGLSTTLFQIQETNPYSDEKIKPISSSAADKEFAVEQILQALNSLELAPKYKDAFVNSFILNKAGADLDPLSESYGSFVITSDQTKDIFLKDGSLFIRPEDNSFFSQGSRDSLPFYQKYLSDSFKIGELDGQPVYYADEGILNAFGTSTNTSDAFAKSVTNVDANAALIPGPIAYYKPTTVFYSYDITTVLEENPVLREIPINDILDYYEVLQSAIMKASIQVGEEDLGGLPPEVVQESLYKLPVSGNMYEAWTAYLQGFAWKQDRSVDSSLWEQYTRFLTFDPDGSVYSGGFPTAYGTLQSAGNWKTKGGGDFNPSMPMKWTQFFRDVVPELDWNATEVTNFFANALTQMAAAASINKGVQGLRAATGAYTVATGVGNLGIGAATELFSESSVQGGLDNLVDRYIASLDFETYSSETVRSMAEKFLGSILEDNSSTSTADNISFRESLRKHAESCNLFGGTWLLSQPIVYIFGEPAPFQFFIGRESEEKKLKEWRGVFESIAEELLSRPDVLKAFGLQNLLSTIFFDVTGSEAYPDLDLPFHPYYHDSTFVSPDFYMWNIYEDAEALNGKARKLIQGKTEFLVEQAYESMQRLRTGMNPGVLQPSDKQQEITGLSGEKPLIKFVPEGSNIQTGPNGTSSGPGTSFFQPSQAALDSINQYTKPTGSAEKDKELKRILSTKPSESMPLGFSIQAGEGNILDGKNVSGGVLYPTRIPKEQYESLKTAFESTEEMFGSREGYLNQYKTDPNLEGTEVEKSSAIGFSHAYDLESLKQLCKDSGKDIFGYKRTMRRAYPTFKLFFIEEDEIEDRFLSFDDFYSYNGVKGFSIVRSKKLAADTAIITLQNVSGTLDGSRRDAVVDLDYINRSSVDGKTIAEQQGQTNIDSKKDNQRVDALVLRPGMNVQLRTGYSNNPQNLEVKISGRIADLSYNEIGDLVEITVQSFGTELIQQLKGTSQQPSDQHFKTTHELLGSLMLSPEVVHFGRWEFGQSFAYGEAKDFKFDLKSYRRAKSLSMTRSFLNWVSEHPFMTAALIIGVPAAVRGGKTLWAGGSASSALRSTLLGASYESVASQQLVTSLRVGTGVASDTQAFISNQTSMANFLVHNELRTIVRRLGTLPAASAAAASAKVSEILGHGGSNLTSVETTIKAVKQIERYVDSQVFKGLFMKDSFIKEPLLSVAFWTDGVGLTPVSKIIQHGVGKPFVVTAQAALGIGALDVLNDTVLAPFYNATLGRIKKSFSLTTSALFLSPQDDNLFPPHPKDYMDLDTSWGAEGVEGILTSISSVVTGTETAGQFLYNHWFDPGKFMTKKVVPAACRYNLTSTRIWDVFYEMTLRHPGWVFAPRPYGTKFEYRMFFGPPSQRYWAMPPAPGMNERSNALRRHIENGVTASEFDNLYGVETRKRVEEAVLAGTATEWAKKGKYVQSGPSYVNPSEAKKLYPKAYESVMLNEYLRALNLRFIPFRRYHCFTSDRDIVWNGITSSDSSVYNAVDVRYYNIDDVAGETTPDESNTILIKAHSFLDNSNLNIKPLDKPNCKSAVMATRYGMGELIHSMKKMYRGQIVLLGDSRVRPWDTAILIDTYNDMVGPIEIEQVIDTFSPETGWITEITPEAIVIGNEISSWPMVEAAKIYALAVKDIEDKHSQKFNENDTKDIGVVNWFRRYSGNSIGNSWFNYVSGGGSEYQSYIKEKYTRIFGADGASAEDLVSEPIEGGVKDLVDTLDGVAQGIEFLSGLGLMAAGGRLGVKAIPKSYLLPTSNRMLAAGFALTTFGGAVTVGATLDKGIISSTRWLDFPSAIWLFGQPQLLLKCHKNETIIIVPLMKSGYPMVAGVGLNDPDNLWNSFRGELTQYLNDSVDGTKDMIRLYKREGTAIWSRLEDMQDIIWQGVTDSKYIKPSVLERN